jgi:meso-butanediol dehydrogenase/(S,S)-butanediol dehydrogenase/diacetyl reductase
MQLQGKKALVTGAGRGIGQAIAIGLARAGADVAVADITLESVAETAAAVRALGRKAVELAVNVVDYDQVRGMVQRASTELGTIDVAVNNAGVLGLYKVSEMEPPEWDRVMNINARGVFYCCKAELEVMQPRKFGRIINTASIAGKVGLPDMTHYTASKFGIVGTGMWRGPDGVAQRWANPDETEEQAWARLQATLLPQGEAQTSEDMADMVVYLATAAHVTGQALAVDGGFSL